MGGQKIYCAFFSACRGAGMKRLRLLGSRPGPALAGAVKLV